MRVLMTTDTVGGVWTFTQELDRRAARHADVAVALVSFGRRPSLDASGVARSACEHAAGSAFTSRARDAPLEWMQRQPRRLREAEPLLLTTARRDFRARSRCTATSSASARCRSRSPARHGAQRRAELGRSLPPERPRSHRPGSTATRALVQAGLAGADAVVAPRAGCCNALPQHFACLPCSASSPTARIAAAATSSAARESCRPSPRAASGTRPRTLRCCADASAPFPSARRWRNSARIAACACHDAGDLHLLGPLERGRRCCTLFARERYLYLHFPLRTFGLAPLEAALCGCAVLANDIPSCARSGATQHSTSTTHASLERSLHRAWHRPRSSSLRLQQARPSRARAQYTPSAWPTTISSSVPSCRWPHGTELSRMSRKSSHRLLRASRALRLEQRQRALPARPAALPRRAGPRGHRLRTGERLVDRQPPQRAARRASRLQQFSTHLSRPPRRNLRRSRPDTSRSLAASACAAPISSSCMSGTRPSSRISCSPCATELGFRLLFHDTHHRASSSPEQIALFGLDRFDGILAFGEALRRYLPRTLRHRRVWTLHEAADTTVFHPSRRASTRPTTSSGSATGATANAPPRSASFCSSPRPHLRASPLHHLRRALSRRRACRARAAGVRYGGYLPNLDAPAVYAAARLTVHIPRQQYAAAMTGIPTIRVFEALACGIPLISAPWQDTEELFRDGDFLHGPTTRPRCSAAMRICC